MQIYIINSFWKNCTSIKCNYVFRWNHPDLSLYYQIFSLFKYGISKKMLSVLSWNKLCQDLFVWCIQESAPCPPLELLASKSHTLTNDQISNVHIIVKLDFLWVSTNAYWILSNSQISRHIFFTSAFFFFLITKRTK